MKTQRDERITDVTKDDDHIAITFKFNGDLFTLIGLPSAEDYFINHSTGEHLHYDPRDGTLFAYLTDFFSRNELWDV